MTDKSNAKVTRHPLAIAWDEWLASSEGQSCANFASLTGERYLENRLHCAFSAGAATAQSNLAREALNEISDVADESHENTIVALDVLNLRLRALFTKLGISVDERGE
jgi:hypothetical protein